MYVALKAVNRNTRTMKARKRMQIVLLLTLFGLGDAFILPVAKSRRLVSIQEGSLDRDPFPPTTDGLSAEVEPVRTLGGGADMIFEMARQMLLWDETGEESISVTAEQKKPKEPKTKPFVLPRWRPIRGVSDANPAFRTTAPMMNSQGYAGECSLEEWKTRRHLLNNLT